MILKVFSNGRLSSDDYRSSIGLMSHRGGDDACEPHAPQWPLQVQQPPGFPVLVLPFLICHSLHSLCAVAFFNLDSMLFPSRGCTAI